MAVDVFLDIDGIKGESTDHDHKGGIDVLSFSWGLTNDVSPTRAGNVSVHDISITHRMDKSSPGLMFSCASGKHITEATLTVRTAGKPPLEYMKIKMEDVLVSSYQAGGHSSGIPTGEFSLNFSKIDFAVAPILPGGKLGSFHHAIITNDDHPSQG
jgi:type VI secretion system secreted protein Hcp